MMNKKAAQLVARIALPPNLEGACGTEETPEILEACIREGKCTKIREILPTFKTMFPNLQKIADAVGMDVLDYPVVEAYWLGNALLDREWSDGVIPFHLTQVLGTAHALPVDPEIASVNACMIRWGIVTKVEGKAVSVDLNSLQRVEGKYTLVQQLEKVQYRKDFDPKLKVGDTVVVHRGYVCMILAREEEGTLSKWTIKVLESQE